jgi:TRAP-type uncharacterized transport system substrate-binding protein
MGKFKDDVTEQIEAIRETVVEVWHDFVAFVTETWPALTLLLILLVVAIWVADPAPPRQVWMATGPEGSSNQAIGRKYAEYFAKQGIKLHLVQTEGSVENVKRLQDRNDPIMAGLVMSGAAEKHAPGIETLGSINYQPLWCFYRNPVPIDSPIARRNALLSRSINVGTPNSGTHMLTLRVLKMMDPNAETSHFSQLPDDQAIEAIRKGKLDGMCLVDTYESPNVQKIMHFEGLQLSAFDRAEAFSRLVPAIEVVTVPEGALSLETNRPPKPQTLISATTELVIDDRLHPAIQTLLLMAAREINGKQTFFATEGEFPAFKDNSLNRSHEAQIFYEKGVPVLMDYLPFWLAEFIRRLVLMLLPFLAVAYPIVRSMPNYHKNRVRGRINRMYGALKFFEQTLLSHYDPAQKAGYLAQIDDMEREALAMKVPKSIAGDYYTLRSSLDYVRNCIARDGYLNYQMTTPGEAGPDLSEVEDESDDQ